MQYSNLDITITQSGAGYDVEARAESGDIPLGREHGPLNLPFGNPDFEKWLKLAAEGERSNTIFVRLGTYLFESLFQDRIHTLFVRSLDLVLSHDNGVRVRLSIDPPEIAVLPWEFLYWPERNDFLAASIRTPLVRYVDPATGFGHIRSLNVRLPLRMLVMVPYGSGLDTEVEEKAIEQVAHRFPERLVVEFLRGQPLTAQDAARHIAAFQPHIIHFIGHGHFDPHQNKAMLFFNDNGGRLVPVSGQQVRQMVHNTPSIKLVLLNACEGGSTSNSGQAYVGMAPALVRAGVPAVVAMQYSIRDDIAIAFAQDFYDALLEGDTIGHVDAAVAVARSRSMLLDPDDRGFGTPVLFLRAVDGIIFRAVQERGDVREHSGTGSFRPRTLHVADCQTLRQLLAIHRRNLNALTVQKEYYAPNVPLHIESEIEHERLEIISVQQQMERIGC